jgi:DnaJ-class molecular chaperone
MPIRGEHDKRGDLLAEVMINYPNHYSGEQMKRIKEIFDAVEEIEEL